MANKALCAAALEMAVVGLKWAREEAPPEQQQWIDDAWNTVNIALDEVECDDEE